MMGFAAEVNMAGTWFYCALALLSACSWAVGAVLWRKLGEHLSSYAMNLAKTALGSLFLGAFLLLAGMEPISARDLLYLALSGIVGIAIGDTFFFLALMELGPRRASLIGSLNPVAIAVTAVLLLGERPTAGTWIGIVATTIGVGWVLWERASTSQGENNIPLGIRYGLLSVLCTAGAVILAKVGVASVPAVHAAFIRLAAAAAGLVAWGAWRSTLAGSVVPFRKPDVVAKTAMVVVVVVAGGFWLSLVALKHLDAALAGPLNSTAPLFILPLSVIFLKERLSLRSIVGTVIAVCGVGLILAGI